VNSPPPLVTFLSDYGLADGCVGACHAVIARRCPAARIIDLTHAIPRHDVRAGATALRDALPYASPGVHLAVVDPGVGSERRAIALTLGDGRVLVGPDNGLLLGAAEDLGGVREATELTASREWLEPLSATFHGRDIFAPVAAAIADGVPPPQLGVPLVTDTLVRLDAPTRHWNADVLITSAVAIDTFGNVSLDAGQAELARLGERIAIAAPGGRASARVAEAYADGANGEPIVLLDSARRIAIAVNGGSAAAELALSLGATVRLESA
jgi:S-adenosylmethionine hydrolase